MAPILLTVGNFSLPSFGLFLALGFILATVLVWRQIRAWDLDEEKVLDLTLVTFFSGLIGARIYFVFTHLNFFLAEPIKIFLFNKYPGLSFWGGLVLGSTILTYFIKRFKLNFWQIGDVAILALLGGMVLGNIGCFFGSCGVGVESKLFFATQMAGFVGKRFPVQFLGALILLLILARLWPQAIKFHVFGQILSKGLIYFGVINVVLENYRDQKVSGIFSLGYIFSVTLILVGIFVYIKVNKRSLIEDLKSLFYNTIKFVVNSRFRKSSVEYFWRSCYNNTKATIYNAKISWSWRLRWISKLLKKMHVKPTPKNLNQY